MEYNIYIYIYIYMSWVQVTPSVTLSNVTLSKKISLNVNLDKSIAGLHYFRIFSILTKFKNNQRSTTMLSISF